MRRASTRSKKLRSRNSSFVLGLGVGVLVLAGVAAASWYLLYIAPQPAYVGLNPASVGATASRHLQLAGNVTPADLDRARIAAAALHGTEIADTKRGVTPVTVSDAARVAKTYGGTPFLTSGQGLMQVDQQTPGITRSFDGINAVQDATVLGTNIEPPDQGLCASDTFVMEMVNASVATYHHDGSVATAPVSMNAFFAEDPNEFMYGPQCTYDAASKSWVAIVEAIDNESKNGSHIDIGVLPNSDPTGIWTIYRLDTTNSGAFICPCWPDNARLGVDAYGIYITQNEFNLAWFYGHAPVSFEGATFYAISKHDATSLQSSPYYAELSDINLGGMLADAVQPAAMPQGNAPAMYFMSALWRGTQASNRIGVWAMTNRQRLDSGGIPDLNGITLTANNYIYPPLAAQKGSNIPVTANDDRMQHVAYYNGTLWASLNAAVNASGDTENRAGVAWFSIKLGAERDPLSGAHIQGQGYLGAKGLSLLNGNIAVNAAGQGVVVVSVMGPDTFPSVAYTTFSAKDAHASFSPLHIAAAGSGPVKDATCTSKFGSVCSWGDYSATAVDSSDGSIWLAAEYIPGPSDTYENWGTRILQLQPGS